MSVQNNILIFGYGNPGRQDDGLGISFIEEIENWIIEEKLEGIETDSNYQLNIEDAETISNKQIVLFVDATIEPIDDFCISKVKPSEATIEFTMHAVSTSFVLDLCEKLYNMHPETYLLHLKGYEWEFAEGLSQQAMVNLKKALKFVKDILKEKNIEKVNASFLKVISEYSCSN